MSSDEGYRVLLLDLDGTIVDYARTEAAALGAVHTEFFRGSAAFGEFTTTFHACNGELWTAYRGGELSLDQLRTERFTRVARLLRAAVPVPAVVARFEAELGRRATLFPEAWPALRALRRLARLVLVTDGIAAVQHAKLSRCRLRRFFEHVVISSEVGFRKPQAALLHTALDHRALDHRALDHGALDHRALDHRALNHAGPGRPDDCGRALVVGDSGISDGAGAHAAGLDFCWVNRTGQAAGAVPVRFQVPDLATLARDLAGLS